MFSRLPGRFLEPEIVFIRVVCHPFAPLKTEGCISPSDVRSLDADAVKLIRHAIESATRLKARNSADAGVLKPINQLGHGWTVLGEAVEVVSEASKLIVVRWRGHLPRVASALIE